MASSASRARSAASALVARSRSCVIPPMLIAAVTTSAAVSTIATATALRCRASQRRSVSPVL